MKKIYSTILVTLALIIILASCTKKNTNSFTFAFYNVENLFDTIDDLNISDEGYLPNSKVAWNTERYNLKLNNMSKVMKSIDPAGFPALFGICEVENISVVEDLINHPNLAGAGYKAIHKDSPDERGIDVALLYNPEIFKPVGTRFIVPEFPDNPELKTRDILYFKGVVNKNDTLHVFINHWVSRWGGQKETEPHRIQIAKVIKNITDSILNNELNANIIIAGDLNDNPSDTSIYKVLEALEISDIPGGKSLYNLSLKQFKNGFGSLYYKSWDMFDQIIVSTSLITGKNGLKVSSTEQVVFKEDWMLYQPKGGPVRPSRTASGSNYYGGYSDHLPIMVSIIN
ncbi:MAG: endonuclease/exonuclease/phosphatase family protein [Bacteroidetes bacterium]|nr:endonuclease/exonuclease/phosphatase family protein [Bacteroidota bacterium]MBL6944204.1 endonuclease/exonuclease/phosphatase family protein [Bacteroidales bacterium]